MFLSIWSCLLPDFLLNCSCFTTGVHVSSARHRRSTYILRMDAYQYYSKSKLAIRTHERNGEHLFSCEFDYPKASICRVPKKSMFVRFCRQLLYTWFYSDLWWFLLMTFFQLQKAFFCVLWPSGRQPLPHCFILPLCNFQPVWVQPFPPNPRPIQSIHYFFQEVLRILCEKETPGRFLGPR